MKLKLLTNNIQKGKELSPTATIDKKGRIRFSKYLIINEQYNIKKGNIFNIYIGEEIDTTLYIKFTEEENLNSRIIRTRTVGDNNIQFFSDCYAILKPILPIKSTKYNVTITKIDNETYLKLIRLIERTKMITTHLTPIS